MTTFAPPPPSALRAEPTTRDRVAGLGRALRPTTPQLVDAVFALLLVLVALLGLRTTYDGWGWLVAGVVGLVLGLVVTHVLLALRVPGAAVLLVLAAVYFLVAGGAATREHLLAGFLPSGQTFGSLAHTLVFGWKELLTSLPPVDSRGPLMALPFLVGLVGAWAAYGIAVRWRTPPVVLPVPLALLTVSLLLGTTIPASVLVMGLGTGLLLVGWVTARARFARPSVDHGTVGTDRSALVWRASTTVVLLVLAGLGGYLLGPRLPGDDGARTVWRTALTPPFDVSQYPSPLAGFRKYTEPNPAKLYAQTLFTVSGLPDGTPLRIATLDSYDGSVWGAGNVANDGSDSTGGATFQRVGSHIAASGPGTPTTVTVTIPDKGWSDVWLPTVGTVTGLQFQGAQGDVLGDDLRFNVDTNTAIVPSGLGAGISYRMEADVPAVPALPKDLDVGSGSLLDTQTIGFVDDKLGTWSANLTSPWQRLASAARNMVSDGAYTDGGTPGSYQNVYLPGHSLGRMTRFFKSTQLAGDDEQYAAALALVGNRIGVPTRVVLGAIPEKGGVVKGADVRAWVEVQTDDGAWFPILPKDFVPDRNKQPQQQQQRSEEKKVGAQVPPPVSSNPPSVLQGPDQAQNSTQIRKPSKPNPLNPANWPGWLQVLAKFVGIPVLALLVLYLVLRLSKKRRGRKRRTTGSLPLRVAGGWAEIVDTAQDLGMPLAPRLTRLEQASALDALLASRGRGIPKSLPANGADADVLREQVRGGGVADAPELTPDQVLPSLRPLADTANALVFAAADPEDEQVTTFWAQVGDVTKRLRRRASFWQRLRADVSLGGLRRDRRRTPATTATTGASGTSGPSGPGRRGAIGRLRRARGTQDGKVTA